jgi:hypothetical protein
LDKIWRNLSYSLHLLIGVGCFNLVPVDHGGWLAAKSGMQAFVIVKVDPFLTPALATDPVSQACR